MKRWMLSKIRRPSLMAKRIESKTSSAGAISGEFTKLTIRSHLPVRTSPEASLATSDPSIPIAIPTGASFNEGAWFTPSPVTGHSGVFPLRPAAKIIRTFVSGSHGAMSSGNSDRPSISLSVSLLNWAAVIMALGGSSGVTISISLVMARAVAA